MTGPHIRQHGLPTSDGVPHLAFLGSGEIFSIREIRCVILQEDIRPQGHLACAWSVNEGYFSSEILSVCTSGKRPNYWGQILGLRKLPEVRILLMSNSSWLPDVSGSAA